MKDASAHQEVKLTEFVANQVRENKDLLGVVITDRDGVPIVQDWSNSDRELQNRFLQNRQFVASYSSISEQANRLGIGTSDLFIASYSHYQVLQFNELSSHRCLVTLFIKADSNIGVFIGQRDTWKQMTEMIDKQVMRSGRHEQTLA
ncbi:hypothetical protein EB796_016936 [Bugula neritina]|uniref:LAMTOR3 n=1 Tax=Bugula neritina TaxID=10212 RepID=A0A7J7JFZ9_BUGNE|nr:hypothetical protein EB796_023235 [Bugula neritina]KAF6024753.1 hypothetical protein EB796_016936 [Bugula neritina]